MAECSADISVIIPAHEKQEAENLSQQLQSLGTEIIVSCENERAKSLNMGAARAGRKFLWFLHADSTLNRPAYNALCASLQQFDDRLHYFDLEFANDGPAVMGLNAMGANLRSRMLGMPFGDQGLCIRKDLFFKTGGFPEDTGYGEDHLFVRHARRHKIRLQPVGAKLVTSAQAYRDKGWIALTARRQLLWWALMMRR